MATGKRYYWIKLKESFMTSDTVDFLMSQKDGANYVVLYQMLCLKTINTGGRLSRTIGEIVIPYDVDKIQRDCKWFSADTIRVALNLYKRFGLIYEERDGTLVLADHENLVGSETDYAKQKRSQRSELTSSECGQCPPLCPPNVPEIVHTDIRDKSLDIRVKEKDVVVVGNPFGDNDEGVPVDTLIVYATSNLKYLSPYNMEELTSFRDSLPDELIRHAIDEACANGVRTYAYTRSILNTYVGNGFKTIGDVEAHEAQRRRGQHSANNDGAQGYQYSDDEKPF